MRNLQATSLQVPKFRNLVQEVEFDSGLCLRKETSNEKSAKDQEHQEDYWGTWQQNQKKLILGAVLLFL